MEIVNTLLFIATAIISLLNLLVEIDDKVTIKHEVYLKIFFGGIATVSLLAIGSDLNILCHIINVYILLALSFRLHIRIKATSK